VRGEVIEVQGDPARLARGLALAAELHAGQVRKGTTIPYLSHLLAVASLVAEDGGDEDQVIAALLHDSAEDQGGAAVLARIAAELGDRVARIVRDCSDSLESAGKEKAPWRERKQTVLDQLPHLPAESLTVIAADKLHNMRSTAADLRLDGPAVWDRFKTGREGFVWYHREMLLALRQTLPRSRSVQLMAPLLDDLGALSNRS
jgi:(p)ppGpp synthase/HD superfamily hydrolase